ncbi:GNAT family N-acetyltransferase [Pseudovibrio exalbescens]|uniref:GNAT family N-acetyltransferase n=1 Tax=Pseudovibrio exalbescens TaxID=197461 RepID=UPI0023655F2C|nr:GNAT family N-acetyltransferase [Pseudovibrio exalbescens]MDD7910761.1 GNAT family N-acetyltransferase [Pseudovibrio exalbescens]
MDGLLWIPMSEGAVDKLAPIMQHAYPHLPDETVAFHEKRALYPNGCFVLVSEQEPDVVLGYVIAHPWRLNDIPPLNETFGKLPGGSDVLYLHDVALLAQVQGVGAAHAILHKLDSLAAEEGFKQIAITAIPQAISYWQKKGFEEVHVPQLEEKLLKYGMGSKYMLHTVNGEAPAEEAD